MSLFRPRVALLYLLSLGLGVELSFEVVSLVVLELGLSFPEGVELGVWSILLPVV